jgi:drug/metabolite transporter (DMT)-like permease
MLAIIYGLAAAAGYGLGDYLAGVASRRAAAVTVALVAKLVAAGVLFSTAALLGDEMHRPALAWGAAAGVALGLGSIAFYRALAVGWMGVIAAIMGVGQALVPFFAGVAFGERPSSIAVVGAIVAVLAIALVSLGSGDVTGESNGQPKRTSGVLLGAFAGLLFGLFFILLDRAEGGGALYPSATAMLSGAITVLFLALAMRRKIDFAVAALPATLGVGCCSAIATVAFVLGVREGLLSIVAVVEGLSPAVTALCAYLLAKEQLSPRQLMGFMAAIAGVLMMAIG